MLHRVVKGEINTIKLKVRKTTMRMNMIMNQKVEKIKDQTNKAALEIIGDTDTLIATIK